MKVLLTLLLVFGVAYGGLVFAAWKFQHKLVFFPSSDMYATPDAISLPFEDVFLTTADDVKIHGWFVPARSNQRKGTILFFHGNAGNITHRLDTIRLFNQLHHDVLIIDYRGYGQSEGTISEKGSYLDARAAYKFLREEKNIPAEEIILFGRSLGGGVAGELARHVISGGVVLESTFTSIPDVGAKAYPLLPVRLLSRIQYPNVKHVSHIKTPLLIIHSPGDEVIPYEHGQALHEAAGEHARFLTISGSHNNGFLSSGRTYTQGLYEFLGDIASKNGVKR